MERQFHTQFFRAEPEVCIVELSMVTQRSGETADRFIARFKRMRNKCKIYLPETEFVKMAQRGLDIELRKKFQGMEFRDFYELAAKVAEYEELLREESQWRKAAMGSYCQEVDTQEIAVADLSSSGSCVCPLLIKKAPETWKKTSSSNTSQFSFDVAKTEEIFDFLLKEKFLSLPTDHKIPSREELKGREYCKYHNSFNHPTNNCWGFRNVVQDRINKGILKFPEKKEAMLVDEDPFPPVANVNAATFDLREVLNAMRK